MNDQMKFQNDDYTYLYQMIKISSLFLFQFYVDIFLILTLSIVLLCTRQN